MFLKNYKDFRKYKYKIGDNVYHSYMKLNGQYRTLEISYSLTFYQRIKCFLTGTVQVKIYNIDKLSDYKITKIN